MIVDGASNGLMLAPLCMIYEKYLRGPSGIYPYRYEIVEGAVGLADGVGFVFDTQKVQRKNIQEMVSIFLNRHGNIVHRDGVSLHKLRTSLPQLCVGMVIELTADLVNGRIYFRVTHKQRVYYVDVGFLKEAREYRTGFFCAVVTNQIGVTLH